MANPPFITPIETIYNGYRFRSRLEARWAVFFDALKIQYEYEKEGYKLMNGAWYLPDFWLPDYRWIVEIKPEYPSAREIEKLRIVAAGLDWKGLIFYGPIPNFRRSGDLRDDSAHRIAGAPGCVYSLSHIIADEAWNHSLILMYEGVGSEIYVGSTLYPDDEDRVPFFAFDAARQARFEYGERPV